jgi:RHS repeat-associated protein
MKGFFVGRVRASVGTRFACAVSVLGLCAVYLAFALSVALLASAPAAAQNCPEPKSKDPGTFELCEPTEVPDGTINANPVLCTIPAGSSTCSSTISWTTINASSASVQVWARSLATQTETLFASATSGSQVAPWITASGHRFDLKINGLTHGSVEVRGNRAPTVSLTSPTAGAAFLAGQSIAMAASASDTDGSIVRVEFYNGTTKLGEDSTAPYTYTWPSVPAGSYSLTARAIDNQGAATTSAPVSVSVIASVVKLTSTNKVVQSTVTAPQTASATFRLASAGKIRFQTAVGGAFVEQAPFDEWLEPENALEAAKYEAFAQLVSGTLSGGTAGQWQPMTVARDWTLTRSTVGSSQTVINVRIRRIGTTTVLAAADVTLNATVTNPPPTVTITAPASGSSFASGVVIPLQASASDSNGTVSTVEFFRAGSTLIGSALRVSGTAANGTWEFNWPNAPLGTHSITAKATDNDGATTTSSAITVVVSGAVSLSSQNKTVTSEVAGPATASATVRMGAEGKLYFRTTAAGAFTEQSPLTEWLNPESTTEAANYEVWAQLVSGTLSAGSAGQWLRMNLARDWTLTRSTVGSSQTVINVRIRRIGTTTVLAAADVTLNATVTNPPPTVTITAPASGSSFASGVAIPLQASASDSNGTVSTVEFFRAGSTLIGSALRVSGTAANGTWEFNWPNAPLGTHSITAKATDNDGATTTSSAITVVVSGAVSLSSQNKTVTSEVAGPATASATVRMGAEGKLYFRTTAAGAFTEQSPLTEWLNPESTTEAANYEVWAQLVSGTLSAGSAGQWLRMNLARDWTLTRSTVGSSQTVINVRIRRIGTTTVLAAADVTLNATVTNPPPTVTITAPASGSSFASGVAIPLQASASDSNGTVSTVEFFRAGSTLIGSAQRVSGTVANGTWEFNWPNAPLGTHSVTTKATDNDGAATTSPPVTITVNAAANVPPTVSLTSPANGATFTAPASITLAATANDSDGTVAKVEFFNGASKLGEDTTAPYSFSWTNVAAGSYTLTAKATDNDGAVTTSTEVSITVNAPSPPPNPSPVSVALDALSDQVGATAGEFRVDESGAATYSIPLFAAPGTAGVAPQLALSYSSQGGAGPLGQGWSISGMSSISRCRASREAGDFVVAGQAVDGDPGPVDFSSDDRFCLDGQRLVEVTNSPACATVSGATARQLRTELESFQRVCAYSFVAANGPRFFTVERQDGSTSWYGDRRTNATQADGGVADGYLTGTATGQTSIVYLWAQTRFQDSTGNYIDYEYLKNPGGVDRPGEHLLSRVRYTGKVVLPGQSGSALAPYAEIAFDYEPLLFRRSYFAGSQVWQTRLLTGIRSINDGTTVRFYRLNFPRLGTGLAPSPSGSGSVQMASIKECRDETEAVCLAPTVFDWSQARHEFASTEMLAGLQNGSIDKFEGLKFADIDGDGRQDLVWAKNGKSSDPCPTDGIHVSFGRLNAGGTPFFTDPPGSVCAPAELLDEPDSSWFLLDYDGDGRDDLFMRGLIEWVAYRSTGVNGAQGHPFDTSVNLLATLSPNIPAGSDPEKQPQLADLNGDGLTDIIYARNGQLFARIMERGGTFGFTWGAERALSFFGAATDPCTLFGADCSYTLEGLYQKDNFQQLIDFNGDSRSDLLVLADVTGQQFCSVGGPDPGPGPDPFPPIQEQRVNPRPFERPQPRVRERQLDTNSVELCTRRVIVGATVERITPTTIEAEPYGDGLWNWFERTEERIAFADINGDGLTDALRLMPANRGFSTYVLNTGSSLGGPVGASGLVVGLDESISHIIKAQLVDTNGDGRAELVYPNNSHGTMARRMYSDIDAGFGPEQTLPGGGAVTGCSSALCLDGRSFMFGDYDGDGGLDFLRIEWKNSTSPMYVSRAGDASRYRPRDVIDRITNGLGAITDLSYLPLTNAAVYRRDAGSRNALNWGRGSPVQDFVAPMYVVHRASSSAPIFEDGNATSTLFYRYQGAKLQAGGRGFLGFRQVISIDPNTLGQTIVGLTDYAQNFPFIGQPIRTRQRLVSDAVRVPDPIAVACATAVTDACFLAGGVGFSDLTQGTLLSDSSQVPEAFPAFAPGSQAPLHVRLAGSTEDGFDPTSGVRTSRVETTFVYDPWGNVSQTAVDSYTGTGGTPTASVTTANTYVNDGAKWRLGRLTASTVTHSRPGLANVVRSTSFAYDMSGPVTGFLTREQVQPGGGADKDLRTFYVLDQFGNRLRTHTCSAQLSEAECTSTAVAFQPSDALRIQRYSRQSFDSRGRYVTAVYQPYWSGSGGSESAVQTILSRDVFGEVRHARDFNDLDSYTVSGHLGRGYYSWVETVPGGTPGGVGGRQSWTTYRWCGTGVNQVDCPSGARFRQQVRTDGAPSQWTYFDVLGRPLLTAGESFNAIAGQAYSAVCSYSDRYGRGSRTSEPFFLPLAGVSGAPAFGGGNPCLSGRDWTVNQYDAVGRPLRTDHPDGSWSGVGYAGLTTTFTDQRGITRTETRNALGELVSATDAGGLTTSYSYDAAGNLTRVSRDAGRGAIVNTQVYDALGRKTQQSDPDSGTWAYAYNALGEQVAQTDLLGQATRQRYDARGRVIERISESAPGVIELSHRFVFDTGIGGKGQLAEESSTGGYAAWSSDGTLAHDFRRTYSYDSLGRPVGSVTRIDGAGYATVTRYDALGRAWQSQDASGNWLKTQFDARGFAAALCESSSGDTGATCNATGAGTYTRTLATDARGNVIHERRGGTSALDVIRTFDRFTGRLESVCSGGSCGIQDDRYAFDAAGNLIRRDIGGQYAEVFSYDPLNRLTLARYERVLATTWSPDTGPVSTEQRYDALGNICQKTIGATQQNYSYGGRAGCGLGGTPGSGTTSSIASPHAVTAAAGGVFFYDGHGNQVTADYAGTASDRFIRYSVEQQAHEIALASQTSPSQRSRFWYGSDGQRYKREDTATGQSTKRTLYLGSVEIIQQGGIVTTKRYIAGIVVQDITATATTTQYLFHDHIGSIVRVTNASGGIIEGMDFGAFGERRGYVDPRNLPVFPASTNRGFTGHEMLDGLDVVHMNGRIYDSKLGRFLQADPIIQEPNNGQNFNRYSYVLNNPLSYTDPSGFSFLKKFRTFAAIAVAIAAPYAAAAIQGVAITALTTGQAFAAAVAGGFASGVISGGTLKSGLFGAFSATLFFGVGETFKPLTGGGDFLGGGLSRGAFGAKVLAHGIAGGVMAELQGGKFGHGFASAGVTQAFSGRIDRIPGEGTSVGRVAAAAIVGGTASALSGGKFGNGAVTAAFGRAFNETLHRPVPVTDEERAFLKQGDLARFWRSRFERGDPLGRTGASIWDRGNPLLTEADIQLGETTTSRLLGALATRDQLNVPRGAFGGVTLELFQGLAQFYQGELQQIGLEVARGHIRLLDRSGGAPVGVEATTRLHHQVFEAQNLPPTAFGGTPFGGSLAPGIEARIINRLFPFCRECPD